MTSFSVLRIFTGTADTFFRWKCKRLPEEIITTPALRLNYFNNAKIREKLDDSCLKQDKVSFTRRNVIKFSIIYEINIWSCDLNLDFTLKDCLFEAVKLTVNPDTKKYSYSGYGIGFDSRW